MTRNDVLSYDNLSDKEKEFIDASKGRGNSINNKSRQSYMAQPNVREFNKDFYKKALQGRPMRWSSVEELESELQGYFDLCDRTATIPTVTAICTWLHCNRDTFYSHANNPNSPFSDILKNVLYVCNSSLENGAIDGKVNAVLYMFLGKNYFNLKDDKNITVTPANSNNSINTSDTMDAIQKQLSEENVEEAIYTDK